MIKVRYLVVPVLETIQFCVSFEPFTTVIFQVGVRTQKIWA